jgi:hypothetical protein
MVDARLFISPAFKVFSDTNQFRVSRDDCELLLVIQKNSGQVKLEPAAVNPKGSIVPCYGLLGIANFRTSSYLVVIREASFVGRLKDSKLFRVEEVSYLPFTVQHDADLVKLHQRVMQSKALYFSYDYDLTHSMQRIALFTEEQKRQPLWQRAHSAYFWNSYISEAFIQAGAHSFILPVIQGYVQVESTTLGGQNVDYALLSRRDHRRAGRRFFTRGLDARGNSANFVETEQILVCKMSGRTVVNSYVQVRGSIPLLWSQKPTLEYMPKGKVEESFASNLAACRLHVQDVKQAYGNLTLVNLVDKKGNQLFVGDAFTRIISELKDSQVRYEWFDFHAECKGMKYDNLAKLVLAVQQPLEEYSYFSTTLDLTGERDTESQIQRQVGVFRTNCMDSLDRTNVVQSVFARRALLVQLHALKLVRTVTSEAFQPLPAPLEALFREFWVSNANELSKTYAGTRAQKTDFTRVGRRTYYGMLDDGTNALQRYFINNFYDSQYKDSYDLFLGRLTPAEVPLQPRIGGFGLLMAGLSALLLCLYCLSYSSLESWKYWVVVAVCCDVFYRLLKAYGGRLVPRPLIDN